MRLTMSNWEQLTCLGPGLDLQVCPRQGASLGVTWKQPPAARAASRETALGCSWACPGPVLGAPGS